MTPERVQALQNFIRHLVTALSQASLYSLNHPQVSGLCTRGLEALREALGPDEELSLLLLDDQFVVGGEVVPGSMYLSRLARALAQRHVSHLKILRPVTEEELRSLVAALAAQGGKGELRPTPNLRFGTVEVRFSPDGGAPPAAGEGVALFSAADVTDDELARFMEVYEGVRAHKELKVVGIYDLVGGFINGFKLSGFIDTFKQEAVPLLALAPMRARDEGTFTHATNVCILTLAQAMALGIEGALLHEIGVAALLHDIGRQFLPEELVHKTGRLSAEEWQLVQEHPVRGALFLLETPGVPRRAVVTAFEHHLRYDMSGFPAVPPTWQQSLCSQMTAVADYYDILRTNHGSGTPLDHADVASFMRDVAGTELHPQLVENFLAILARQVPESASQP